ncbi:hypothetical protein PR202_ga20492 [Eleusine coracana subsp. coracana]|uniref:adenylate dimethylallyltransferase (ADP/ATP-dependent) n=1 Tax=Eleusine coracana subsp. coracana TaxID=191504 RepID=A0AAV5CZ64_ELECO|nr:hypothetical protein QOZ80_4AG0319390 [Eleusine coracana subsp. coracana]GJN03085.1 hypothetical protein PR202_ga20492 [Eleusine coracana subsp. coracana]
MEQARVEARKKPKVLFVLGATATGKSKLAVAIAKRFDGEVINADKIQVHDGAPVITNKVTEEEMAGVPHHLLDVLPADAEFTAEDFRREAGRAVARVLAAGRLPVVAGGSNSYVEELVDRDGAAFRRAHDVLFVSVDAAPELLRWYTALRVDDMVARGLVDEARAAFHDDAGAGGAAAEYTRGVRRAIGLPEMHAYLLAEREGCAGEEELAGMLARAVQEIKDNIFGLAQAQVAKIQRLSTLEGWDVRRVDATPVFARMAECSAAACDKQAWESLIWEPSEAMVRRFLETTTLAAPVVTVEDNASIAAGGGGSDGKPTNDAVAADSDGDGGVSSDDRNANIVTVSQVQ